MIAAIKQGIAKHTYLWAAALVLTGAVCFSSKAIFIKLAYRYDIDSVSLLSLRMLFSLPFFIAVAIWASRRGQPAPLSRRDYGKVFLTGVTGYYLASLFDFLGLQYISAGMERLVLFVYPTLVLLLSALLFRQPILPRQYLALALTYSGIGLAFAEGARQSPGGDYVLGASLVFISALCYALYLMYSGRLLPRVGTLRYNSLAMMAAALAVLIHHGIAHQWALSHYPAPVYGYALLMAVFATVLPSFLIAEGIRIIGAGNASIIGSVGPVSTIVLAYYFLGEGFGWYQWGGTLLVIAGVLLISLRRS